MLHLIVFRLCTDLAKALPNGYALAAKAGEAIQANRILATSIRGEAPLDSSHLNLSIIRYRGCCYHH